MKSSLLTVAFAAALLGCAAFRVPDLPAIEERPGPTVPVYVLGDPGATPEGSPLLASLRSAGFSPTFVSDIETVPGGSPVIENHLPNTGCANSPGMGFYLLSFGILPGFGCEEFGHRFDLRPSKELPAQRIDTHVKSFAAIGWLVGPLNLLPQFSADLDRERIEAHERRALRAAVLDALGLP